MPLFGDRVKELALSDGLDTFVLGGVFDVGFQTFLEGCGEGTVVYIAINPNDHSQWEIGTGTLEASGTHPHTITRTVLNSSTGAKVNFTEPPIVFSDLPAALIGTETLLAALNAAKRGANTDITSLTSVSIGGASHRALYTQYSGGAIAGLISGSTTGALVEAPANMHYVVGLRENDAGDSFAIVSGGGNYSADSVYDLLVARFWASGAVDLKIGPVTLANDGLHLLDTDASHDLIVKPGSDLTADRTLTVTTGDVNRTITLTGDASLTGTNTGDQTITLTGDVTGSGTGSFAATIANDAVSNAKAANMVTNTVKARVTAGTGDPEDVAIAANQFLARSSAGQLAVKSITDFALSILDDADAATARATLALVIGTNVQAFDADLSAVAGLSASGLIARTGSGTAAARTITGTANEITVGNGDGVSGNPTLSLPAALSFSGKTVTGGTFASPTAITGLPDPSSAQDAATKAYVDSVAAGLDVKASVKCATTANITLSGEQTLDGVTTSASRVLVKNQSTASQNGIYVSAAGAWSRVADMNHWDEVPGSFVFVEEGTTLADTGWVCTSNTGGTIGSASMAWSQFSGAGTYTATGGITLTGTQFSLTANGVTDTILRDSAALSVIGRGANSTGDPGDIAAGSDGHVLRRSGTTLAFGTVATAGLADGAATNAKLADMATNTIKARVATGTGDPEDLAIAANQFPARASTGQLAAKAITDFGLSLVDDADAAAGRTTLDVPSRAGADASGTWSISITGNAGTVTVADTTDTTCFVGLFESATGSLAPKTDAGIAYNATTGMLTVTGVTAPLTGNASTATALQNARTIGAVSFDGTADIVPQTVQVVDSTDASSFVAMFDSATGNLQPKTDANLTYNASSGTLTAGGLRIDTAGLITRSVDNGSATLCGGTTAGDGASFIAVGDAHASLANDFRLATPTKNVVVWDNSASELQIADSTVITKTSAGAGATQLILRNASVTASTEAKLQLNPSNATTRFAEIAAQQQDGLNSISLVLRPSAGGAMVDALVLDSAGRAGFNYASPSDTARVVAIESGNLSTSFFGHDGTGFPAFVARGRNAGYATGVGQFDSYAAAGTGWHFWICYSDVDGTIDLEAYMRGDGTGVQDGGTAWGTPADYAEFMENVEGNDLPVGTTVVVAGPKKIRPATQHDDPRTICGVVRPRSGAGSIVANAADLRWQGKYLKDADGNYLLEECEVYQWEEVIPAVTETVKVQATEKKKVGEQRIEIVNGRAIAKIEAVTQDVPLFTDYPIFDESGNAVVVVVRPAKYDADGKEIFPEVRRPAIHREPVMVDAEVVIKKEKREPRSNASYKMPAGLTAERTGRVSEKGLPVVNMLRDSVKVGEGTVEIQQKRKLNPDFDPTVKYVARRDRPEYNLIGLCGWVEILKGQPVNPAWKHGGEVAPDRDAWLIGVA